MTVRNYPTEGAFALSVEEVTLSADAAGVSFSPALFGRVGTFYAVEIFTSADDEVTVTINSALGTELFTTTTTGATDGEISRVEGPWPAESGCTYTLSGLAGGGTATIKFYVWKS